MLCFSLHTESRVLALKGRTIVVVLVALFLALPPLHAGGPHYVAGTSYFDRAVTGTPLTWAQGRVNYYTDQGDLSPLLPAAAADAFVADAFSRWTTISTAALSATAAGHLDENVSSSNLFANANGSISLPADILPIAVDKPVAIVYDSDGKVTDALLGAGAGGASSCFTNAVFGGPDNFSTDAHLLHALVMINGNCAQTSQQLPDVKYRLARVLGRVLGLDWSQANLNPTSQDYGGFPLMHAFDPVSCVPVSKCYSTTADQPKMDDRAALSRLYPVTTQNQASFPGKQLFYENTVRFHGSVRFADANGQPAQPMQGVNVVARWVDPNTNLISRTYVASCVSGFLFRGNAGNPVTGFTSASGQPLDRFGSDDPALEGFFDLAGLEIPDGSDTAEYQITIEPVDPLFSQPVGPYAPWQVQPSGVPPPLTVTIMRGTDFEQDIVMRNTAVDVPDWFGPQSFDSPAPVPLAGDWTGTLSGYGDSDYFRFSGQANRTLSVEVTALNERGAAAQSKALPVVGMWTLANPGGLAEAATASSFNTSIFALTRLEVALGSTTDFRIGISDYRGDGRPDFRYRARVFYGDHIFPARASVAGGSSVFIQGFGFRSNTRIAVAGTNAPPLGISGNVVLISAPPMADGVRDVALADPMTGAASTMSAVLTYGAGPSDVIKLISGGGNPPTPVGAEAPNPIRVQVLAPDGVTPVAGASVRFLSAPPVSLSACGGAPGCDLLSDQSGLVSTRATLLASGVATITVQLAPASYSPPRQVQATLASSVATPLDIASPSPSIWIAAGVTLDLPLNAKVLSSGVPQNGKTVNYQVMQGAATLSASTVTTDAGGIASSTLHITSLSGEIDVSACVAPDCKPCLVFHIFPVAATALRLQPVSGSLQFVPSGQGFQPIAVRVTDTAGDPVRAANVVFQAVVTRPTDGMPGVWIGDTNITPTPAPIILGSYQLATQSDGDGLAIVQPPPSSISNVLVLGTATTGVATLPFQLQLLPPLPAPPG